MALPTAKQFLAQECANLQEVLEGTLRFKYGLEGSKQFFEECASRLNYLRDEVEGSTDQDHDRLQVASGLLSNLSDLVSRIERSSTGEYSWAFVEELKRIAVSTCTEPTAADPNSKPQFHVWSSGGLAAYQIQPEPSRPTGSRRRIHTIVLPKTLKNCVLLHSILGHEVGHAMYRCSKHQKTLEGIIRALIAGTVFENPQSTGQWLYSTGAPDGVKKRLSAADLVVNGINATNFFGRVASWRAWIEEILCDLIGLTTFGPSFVAAELNLLYSLDPPGTGVGPLHPPVGCRGNYLTKAASLAGLTFNLQEDELLRASVGMFWSQIESRVQTSGWFNIFPENQLNAALASLRALFEPLDPSLYRLPAESELALLLDQLFRQVPPVGFQIGAPQTVCWQAIDFRQILFAGWIAAANDPSTSFIAINKLCEHAIMQQRAINIELGVR